MDLSIIIVNYNSLAFLKNCIRSLLDIKDSLNKEIIVVDNDSKDESIDFIKTNFPCVRLIENKKNVGFAKANNIGIKAAMGEYVLLLNPDTVVEQKNALEKMVDFARVNKNVGIIGPKLVYPDKSLQFSCRCFYNIRTIILRRTFLGKLLSNSEVLKEHLMIEYSHNEIREVDWVLAACLMISRSVLEKIGYIDDKYRMYFEDVDLCYMTNKAGYKVYYFPESVIIHHHQRESAQGFSIKTIWHIQSAIRFFNKFGWRF